MKLLYCLNCVWVNLNLLFIIGSICPPRTPKPGSKYFMRQCSPSSAMNWDSSYLIPFILMYFSTGSQSQGTSWGSTHGSLRHLHLHFITPKLVFRFSGPFPKARTTAFYLETHPAQVRLRWHWTQYLFLYWSRPNYYYYSNFSPYLCVFAKSHNITFTILFPSLYVQ